MIINIKKMPLSSSSPSPNRSHGNAAASRPHSLAILPHDSDTPLYYMFEKDVTFNSRFDQLLKFRSEYGHMQVKRTHTSYRKLYNWLKNKKSELGHYDEGRRKSNPLTPVQLDKFNDIGFVWKQSSKQTTKYYKYFINQIETFQESNHHLDFFRTDAIHEKLEFVRKVFLHLVNKNSSLGKDRLKQLDDLGIKLEAPPSS
mmetsp:Transcript_11659/g.14538  ORF Transcript_11659/g.14538 Transcript_11659/m.14538 type:complete len:200 (+) Transcript_11659:93-692(+)